MPVQVWAQGGNLHTSYSTLNIWVVVQIGLLPRYQILGYVASIVVTDPRAVGIVLPTTRLQEEKPRFPPMRWSLVRSSGGFQMKVDFWVKFHQNLTGELPLLMNAAEIREAP